MPHASFDGLRVLSLESRRAREVEKLIRTYNGEPVVVPAMREVSLESNVACLDFGRDLLAGRFDLVLFLTGVGVRNVMNILETKFDREAILTALRNVQIACRGVKPLAALRELDIPVAAVSPEPSTWREVVSVLDSTFGEQLSKMRLAVQEYGASNPELLSELVERCASVSKVPVYQWGLPFDLGPLREAVQSLIDGTIDVALFMTAVQVIHLFQVADDMRVADALRESLNSSVVVSVGPATTEELVHYGVRPDFEPSRPRMGFLVNEAAQYARKLLAAKRTPTPPADISQPNEAQAEAPAPSITQSAARDRGVVQVAPSTSTMAGFRDGLGPFDVLHEISSSFASSDPLHVVLQRIVTFVSAVIPCDSCFLYTLEDDKLILRASKNPHTEEVDNLRISIGQGVTGWVAEHRETVAISERASDDPRFKAFVNLPEDRFEAMLCAPVICANRAVGVLTVQHRDPYVHTDLQRRLVATIGVLVGAEVERARLETENLELTNRLETRKVVDRAKGILQRDLNISEEEAYRTMQRESRQRRKSMREIADAILLSDHLRREGTPQA